jgi:hypothetical protein
LPPSSICNLPFSNSSYPILTRSASLSSTL